MFTVTIQEKDRGLLFRGGKFERVLMPGRYFVLPGATLERVNYMKSIESANAPVKALLQNAQFVRNTTSIEVGMEQLALHYIDGRFGEVLLPGQHVYWNAPHEHTFRLLDTSDPNPVKDLPEYVWGRIPRFLYTKIEVASHQRALLYRNNRLEDTLEPGIYYYWKTACDDIRVHFVDIRLIQMNVTGQELLTLDKVSLRVNFVVSYRVTDGERALTEIDDYVEQLHVAAQLALREYVGRHRMDDILENRDGISDYVTERLRARAPELFVEIVDSGVKDVILPGNIRDIMNTVLVAEKSAQANVITRREEVASTRSLLNTARMMDENKTLYRLKELEALERICEKVGNINVNGNGDLLTQLAATLRGGTQSA